jgi:serine beta-lactamase-like protein LACTB
MRIGTRAGAVVLALALIAGASCEVGGAAQTSRYDRAIAAARATMAELVRSGAAPGASAAVAVDGLVVWSEGFGFSDLERRVPATAATKFGIGSVTKSLTTALAGRLAERGALDLDAPVERYVPEFRHKGLGISTRLIAGHLSGLDDSFAAANRYTSTHYATTAEALRPVLDEPLRHAPRSAHFYGTGTYTIIAAVVERASGKDFRTAMRDEVLEPLGLRDTVPNDRRAIVADRTSFYERDGDALVNAAYFDPSHKLAGAGYLSTAGDVARFGAALLEPGYLKPETVRDLFTPLATSAGERTEFALGWRVGTDAKGRRIVHQPGGGPGISCWVYLYPDERVTVAVLSNLTGAPVGGPTAQAIADAFIAARPR